MKLETLTASLEKLRKNTKLSRWSNIKTVQDELCSNMEAFQDNLSFILALEGFFINNTFHARELGYFTLNQECGRHAFIVPNPCNTLSDKDKQTANFVISKIHELSYQPSHTEHAQKGYKGAHVEKDVLKQLNIPALSLETVGCPKYNVLKYQTPLQLLLPSCGFHADSMHHCPVTECSTFWHWYKSGNLN